MSKLQPVAAQPGGLQLAPSAAAEGLAPLPRRDFVGASRTPVLTVDGTARDLQQVRELAAALAPFPPAGNNYPGLRRMIGKGDRLAYSFVIELLEAVTPYVAGAFDLDGFDLMEASFSLVTTPPVHLAPVQRMPHFDSVDAQVYALMLFCRECDGTAFFRHRTTGIEAVAPHSVDRYVARARRDAGEAEAAYIIGDTPAYKRIGHVAGREGRLVAYPGRLLHSGIIPPGFAGQADPLLGRLTCNIFIKGWRNG